MKSVKFTKPKIRGYIGGGVREIKIYESGHVPPQKALDKRKCHIIKNKFRGRIHPPPTTHRSDGKYWLYVFSRSVWSCSIISRRVIVAVLFGYIVECERSSTSERFSENAVIMCGVFFESGWFFVRCLMDGFDGWINFFLGVWSYYNYFDVNMLMNFEMVQFFNIKLMFVLRWKFE